MKKFKMKTVLFISVVLIGLLINSNIFLVKATKDANQEEIIILDDTKINVDDSRYFTIGDIDGDGTSEVITFNSITNDSGVQWIINTYHKKKSIWSPVLSKIYTEEVSGFIHKVDIGNFDNDEAQEIIIASWENATSKIYLFNFDQKLDEFNIEIIYELNTSISDLEVHFDEGTFSDSIYILFCDNVDSVEQFETNVMSITREKDGRYESKIIYSEPKIYWSLFTIGRFFEQKSHKNQILLYRYEVTSSIMRQAVIKIINSDSELLMEETNIGEYSRIRDIIAWGSKRTGVDELLILESENLGDDIGFKNKLFYCTFNQEGLLEKREQLLDSNKILNQLDSGKLDGDDNQLLILDPFLGTMDYLRAFDEEAKSFYDFWGYWYINYCFDVFIAEYAAELSIDVSTKGTIFYHSDGGTSTQLLADLATDTESARISNGADLVIGISRHYPSDWEVIGRAYYPPGRHAIVFAYNFIRDFRVITHEVGHNYDLGHGTDFYCYMNAVINNFEHRFCSTMKNLVDRELYGTVPPPPGGGGGCPFLYVFDGTEYIGEGLLDIHEVTGIDKVAIHTLQTTPSQLNNKIYLRLTEHPQTISDIDHVRLYGRLENGQWVSLQLKSAIHSAIGEVRNLLRFSDDLKVKELGADHNNGISETIDLEFVTDGETSFLEFRFIIEGNNMIIK